MPWLRWLKLFCGDNPFYRAPFTLKDGRVRADMKTKQTPEENFEEEPVFGLLCSYLYGDRDRALTEVRLLMAKGESLKDACEIIIATQGFENSFY